MSSINQPDFTDFEARQSANQYGWTGSVIVTPAGPCPHKLNSTDKEDVEAWAEKVIASGHSNKDLHYSPSALRYFASHFYDLHGKEYQEVAKHITEMFGGEFEARPVPVQRKRKSVVVEEPASKPVVTTPKIPAKTSEELTKELGTLTTKEPATEIEIG